MKRTFLAIFTLALLISSCGGASENKGAENVDSKQEAGQIIAYTNNLIDYLNNTGDWMRSNETYVSNLVKYMENKRRPQGYTGVLMPFTKSRDLKDASAPKVLSEEERTYFDKTVAEYKETFSSYLDDAQTLKTYISNEDFKDDDYARGKELAESIETKHNYLVETKSELYSKIDVVTEKAEKIILADHPLRDPIFALKEDLESFSKMSDIFDEYNEGNLTVDQVDEAYKALETRVEKNKGLYGDLLEEHKLQSSYNSFYKSAESSLATFRKALRNVKAKKKVTDREFKSFGSDYNSLVKSYNRFNS